MRDGRAFVQHPLAWCLVPGPLVAASQVGPRVGAVPQSRVAQVVEGQRQAPPPPHEGQGLEDQAMPLALLGAKVRAGHLFAGPLVAEPAK